jgi:hypothetical protein
MVTQITTVLPSDRVLSRRSVQGACKKMRRCSQSAGGRGICPDSTIRYPAVETPAYPIFMSHYEHWSGRRGTTTFTIEDGSPSRPQYDVIFSHRSIPTIAGSKIMRLTILVLTLMTATPCLAGPTTCSAAIQNCISAATGKVVDAGCKQAGAACMQNGTFVGPVTGKVWKGLIKK